MVLRGLMLLSALLLGGCATLSQSECLQANWTDLGARDGQSGYPAARLEEHRTACTEHGIAPDDRAYLVGREQGLKYYCTPDTGYREGRRGAAYQRVCQLALEAEFLRAYDLGREIYNIEQEISSLRGRIENEERALDDPALSRDERYRHRRELELLYRELDSLQRQRDRLADEPRY
ncbi:MAG TPA: DUF2799 domain-containing protein [Solimonas sp.]|nr:DUF2799 domain-containing protein [Solimonas sp.]